MEIVLRLVPFCFEVMWRLLRSCFALITKLFKICFSDSSPFEISGKVLWDRLKEDDQVEYGIEITAADEQAIEFLLNKLNILEKQPFIPAA